jgi:hypothetical protein
MRPRPSNALCEAVCAAIEAAPVAERDALAHAIEDYARRYDVTWRRVTRGDGLLSRLLAEIVIASCAMPGEE